MSYPQSHEAVQEQMGPSEGIGALRSFNWSCNEQFQGKYPHNSCIKIWANQEFDHFYLFQFKP
jgi:hypothetical protein